MEHAKTIALATDLLADGRADDAAAMIDPLLESPDSPATETGQLLLRALRARIAVAHRADPAAALDLLPARSSVSDLCTCVRAAVLLWRGWARATRHAETGEAAHALRLLDEAHGLYGSLHDPSGECWALLGRAQALFALDEYALLRATLDDAASLVEALDDTQAKQWYHQLCVPALRADEQYEAARTHVDALRTLGDRQQGPMRLRGLVAACEALLCLNEGRSPSSIVEAADTAAALLRRTDTAASFPRFVAYRAHLGALLRRGRWDTAEQILHQADDTFAGHATAGQYVSFLRARLALHRGAPEEAEAPLEALARADRPLPRGLSRTTLFRLRGEMLARTDRPDEAQTLLRRAARCARETGHRRSYLRTRCLQARTAAGRRDPAVAQRHLDAVADHPAALHARPTALHRFAATGTVAQAGERPDDARRAYEYALAAATTIQDSYRTATFQLALAQLTRDERAGALASEAASTFEALGAHDEAEVAHALSGDVSSASSPVADTHELSTRLADTPPSVPLIVDACLRAVAARASDRWVGVYYVSDAGIASPVEEQGTRPDTLSPPPTDSASDQSVRWWSLPPSSFYLGVERRPEADTPPDFASRLASWTPAMGLALARASAAQEASSPSLVPKPGLAQQPNVVARSAALQRVIDQLNRARAGRYPVLLRGESGVGKRRLAEALHAAGPRADGPLKHVAVADMQRHPTAERLFGRADADATGIVHAADGGTLLIEDVDALSLSAQRALLHLLDTGEAVPEGATDGPSVDVRVVATTTSDLDERIRNDHFLPGLRDRLTVLSVTVPPLRERRADIPLLARHFLDVLSPEAPSATLTQPAMEALLRYDWPGNVRQLRNELERALLLVQSEPAPTIDADMLLDAIVEGAQERAPSTTADAPDAVLHPNQTLNDVLARTEKDVIERVLRACDGQVTASAEVLGLTRQGLYKKMKRLDIEPSAFQSPEPAAVS